MPLFFAGSRWLSFPCLLACACALPLAPAAGADAPGLSREKPASGRFVETPHGFMVPYTTTIPGSKATFQMLPIPGGKYRLGSPAGEAGRKADEGPVVEIEVPPLWMSATEVTWAEYKFYMSMHDVFKSVFKQLNAPDAPDLPAAERGHVVTAPSNLYDPTFTFQFGEDPQQPAISMSQFAARQYTKWLSGVTGEFYRLPSEAEWEYACRAGTTTAYSFGDDPAALGDYAWHLGNSDEKTHLVAQKKPNPWGLFDMHGNVAEWTLDAYTPEGYADWSGKSLAAADAIHWPKKLFPRVVRGGSWDEAADRCRSAARHPSHDDQWRDQDPNFPQSPWWFTSGHGLAVGFRLVRPLAPPPPEGRAKFWDADNDAVAGDVNQRVHSEGRGAKGFANGDLRKTLEQRQAAP